MAQARIISVLAVVSLCCAHAVRGEVSRDCEPGDESVECVDEELATLEEYLDRYVAAAEMTLQRGAECLAADQQEWASSVRDACSDRQCLRSAYLNRLSELDALQPGATALRNIQLPPMPQLAWIIPPAEDEEAAPKLPGTMPLNVTGRIAVEMEGDGYVLRAVSGRSVLLMSLMLMDDASAEALTRLAEQDATFLARGHTFGDQGDGEAFDAARCVYIYRPPARE